MAAPRPSLGPLARYAVAILAIALALAIRILFTPITGLGAPWVIFFTAVVIAAIIGGSGPGVAAMLIGAILGAYVFALPDTGSLSETVTQTALFALDGFVLVYLVHLIAKRRRQAETAATAHARSEERLRLVNESAQIGTYDHDIRTQATVSSPQLQALLGLEPEASLRANWTRVVHPDDQATIVAAYQRALDPNNGGHVRIQLRIVRPGGEIRWLSWVGSTYFEDTPTGRVPVRQVGAAVDITNLKNAETELRELNRSKDEFLAMLSHELRNPLAAIRSSVHVLEHAAPGDEMTKRAQRVIDRQAGQLTRLVEDLLDVTRIGRRNLELRRAPFELGELVQRVADDQRALVDARGIELELRLVPEALWLEADAARISQVVGNLIHNAAKFTPHGGRIALALAREQGDAVLRVRDTGVGIPAEALARVFEPFEQLGATISRTEGGLGLGLALVKGLVELHGGAVEAASAGPNQGAEFTIRLPLTKHLGPHVAIGGPAPTRPLRVLVVEDNRDAAEMLAAVLQLMGHEVRAELDGRSGISAAKEFHPDVVLCDIGLPDIDGYEVARRMRADDALRDAVLVALSGYGQPEDRRRALDAGFSLHVVKPATAEILQRTLAQAA